MSENNKTIAFNQSNYPVCIEVYAVTDEKITFKSIYAHGKPCSARTCTNMVYFENNDDGRAYFNHMGDKYYLDECMRT